MCLISIARAKAVEEDHLMKKLQTGLYTTADDFIMICLQAESRVSG